MVKSNVKKNFIYQMLYEILVIILPFVTSPYIARVIGAEGLGTYSYHYSVAYYFVLFSMLGLKNYGNRAVAKARDDSNALNKCFCNIETLHIIISVIFTAAYIGYIFTVPESERVYALIMLMMVLSSLFDISWLYFGLEKFKFTVTRNTIIKIITIVCVFLFVRSKSDLWIYCFIMTASFLVSGLILWVPLKRYVSFVKPEFKEMIVHLKPLIILFIPAIAVSLYKYMDKVMLGAISTKAQLGFYENAEKVINIPITIITSFGTVMLPKMSNMMATQSQKKTLKYTTTSMMYVMWMAYALTFGLAGVATVFAPVFWGEEFVLSGTLIMGLATTIPFMSFANVIRTQYLIPAEKDKEYMASVIAGAVINLIINWLLIPSLGAVGVTIGTIAAEVLVCIVQCFAVRKELPLGKFVAQSMFFLAVGVLMFGVVYGIGFLMGEGIPTLMVQIVVGGIFYCTISFVFLYIKKEPVFMGMFNKYKSKIVRSK